MVTIFDVDPTQLIEKIAEELKKIEQIKAPGWAVFVKTGVHKQRPPMRDDWWHIRAAAILRSVYTFGPIGVSKLRSKYGGLKYRGIKPKHFAKGSGSIIRKILQQLEKADLIKPQTKVFKDKKINVGKIISGKGKKMLDQLAFQIDPTKVFKRDKSLDIEEEKPAKKKKAKKKKKATKKKVIKKEAEKKETEPTEKKEAVKGEPKKEDNKEEK